MELRFLYVGTSDTERDLATWLGLPGARLRWRFRRFSADVAGIDTGAAPMVLLADHRPARSVLPIYSVEDLDAAGHALVAAGWNLEAGPLATPEGDATLWSDGTGSEIALLQVERPGALDQAFRAEENTYAVH